MSFLGVTEFTDLQSRKSVISHYKEENMKNASYELSLGEEVYLTDSKTGKVEILKSDNRQVDINPGQFALLLTKEKVHIPNDKIGFISIKAGEKLKGLVNVSGFHVDPGFNDHLLFSVYNAGASTIVLYFDEPYFPLWLAEITSELNAKDAYSDDNEHFGKLHHIPAKYVEVLKSGTLASPSVLDKRIDAIVEKQERIDWLAKTSITLLAAILLKLLFEPLVSRLVDSDPIDSVAIRNQIRSEIRTQMSDSIIDARVKKILGRRNGLENTMNYDTAAKRAK